MKLKNMKEGLQMETVIGIAALAVSAVFFFCADGYARVTDDPEVIKITGNNLKFYY